MKSSLAQVLIPLVLATAAHGAAAAEPADSINLGLGGLNPMAHCDAVVSLIEYEHPVSPTTSILGRGSRVGYWYDNGLYVENGWLRGLDIGGRYYRAGGMQGWFVGASLGYWQSDWKFTQYQSTPSQWQGTANSDSVRLNFEFGDRLSIQGTNISIMPQANLGKFFSSRSCEATAPPSRIGTPCSQKSEVNAYIFFGVTVGIAL